MPYVKDCNKIDICVYFHRRLVDYKVFYVGMGKIKRAMSSGDRSKWWQNVVKKYGYRVEIVHENLHWEEAARLEIFYIKKFGRADQGKGILVNMTDGGDGAFGKIPWNAGKKHSQKTKDKISKSLIGSKNANYGKHFSEEHRRKIAESNRKTQSMAVLQFLNDKQINEFESIKVASKKTGIPESTIGVCCRKNVSNRNFKWVFKNPNYRKKQRLRKINNCRCYTLAMGRIWMKLE